MSRMTITYLSGLCGLCLFGAVWAAPATRAPRPAAAPASRTAPAADLYADLIPPEFVLRSGAQVGVGQTVIDAIRIAVQERRPKLEEAQRKLRTDTATLNDLIRQDRPDVKACLDQLDKVLDDERVIKRMNLELALFVKNKLTPDQYAKLMQLRALQIAAGTDGAGVPEELRAKLQQVQALAQARQQEGRDVSDVRRVMQDIRTAVQAGRYKAADGLMDQIIKQLGGASSGGPQLGGDSP